MTARNSDIVCDNSPSQFDGSLADLLKSGSKEEPRLYFRFFTIFYFVTLFYFVILFNTFFAFCCNFAFKNRIADPGPFSIFNVV